MPKTGSLPPHQPVLYHEVIKALYPQSPGRYIDATVGAGGHAAGILEHSQPKGSLLGLDLDPVALNLARERLSCFGNRFTLVKASYTSLVEQMQQAGWEDVHGILIDLGVSSMQLDRPEKGFSFRTEGPLDMRFDPDGEVTAAMLVNTLSMEDLVDILWRYGEERYARRIARAIVEHRPVQTTLQLSELVSRSVRSYDKSLHPATRTFQALRIAVNQELKAIETVLPEIVKALKPGGRAAIITFHSLEDRLVKHFIQREARDCICPPRQPVCTCQHKASIRVEQKAIKPGKIETEFNPRARSAKLRIFEKI